MKKIIHALMAVSIMAASCSDNSTKTDNTSATTIKDSVKTSPVDRGNVQDTANRGITGQPADAISIDFVKNAANANMLEIQLGNIAQQKAKSQRVKNFGSMMVNDHTQAANDLKGLAITKSINIPTVLNSDEQMHVDEMNKKSGSDFDKEYMNMMVNGHTKVLNDFKKASNDLKDADLKMFAIKTIPVIEKHLDSAKVISGKK